LATQYSSNPLQINAAFVEEHLGEIAEDEDLSRCIL
jgi:ATP-dependent protease HslVU (ClpYQ) ATPase subunit